MLLRFLAVTGDIKTAVQVLLHMSEGAEQNPRPLKPNLPANGDLIEFW